MLASLAASSSGLAGVGGMLNSVLPAASLALLTHVGKAAPRSLSSFRPRAMLIEAPEAPRGLTRCGDCWAAAPPVVPARVASPAR